MFHKLELKGNKYFTVMYEPFKVMFGAVWRGRCNSTGLHFTGSISSQEKNNDIFGKSPNTKNMSKGKLDRKQ